jgi:hypothetical protein
LKGTPKPLLFTCRDRSHPGYHHRAAITGASSKTFIVFAATGSPSERNASSTTHGTAASSSAPKETGRSAHAA